MATVKTAVSLPTDVYEQVDALARERSTSRSGLITEAVVLFLQREQDAALLDSWNEAYAELTPEEVEADRRVWESEYRSFLERRAADGEMWKDPNGQTG